MIALDTNVLVYAHRPENPWHEHARALVGQLAEGVGRWAIPWPCVHEYFAVVTNPRAFVQASSMQQAWDQLDAWLASPALTLIGESRTHLDHLRSLTIDSRVVGGRVHDARIAAICLSHGVTELVTMDRDFSRFPQLRTRSLLS